MIAAENPEIIREITGMFPETEYFITQVHSGGQCLENIKNHRPDLVVLDINLKDISGYDICRQINTDVQTENIHVLLISDINIPQEDRPKAVEAGADGLLLYPFTAMEIHLSLNPLFKLIRAEHKKLEVLKKLEENEKLFQTLVENSDDIVAICQNNKVLHINQSGLKLFELESIKEIEGKDITSFLVPDNKIYSLDRIENALKTGSPYFTEDVFLSEVGKHLPLNIKVVPINWGGVSSILLVGRITSEKFLELEKLEEYSKALEEKVQLRLEELSVKSAKLEESQKALTYLLEDVNESRTELETANSNLQMLNRELEAFTYSVSHDLRAPIRAIDGFSRILMEEYANQLDDEGKRLLNIIVKSASNMQRLIDDLLAFSRLGPKQPAMHIIDTGSLISGIIEEFKTGNPDRRITWIVSDLPEIFGDQGMLRQVFANIIGNAVKFTSKADEAVIEISGEYSDDKTKIRIKDNGVGFDMKYAPKVFEVFQRLHDPKEFEGTGIGMAIVKKILDKHNGQVIPESELNAGSVFTIILPRS